MKAGDKVAVVAETINGIVKEIHGDQVTIIDDDGFERTYSKFELAIRKGTYKFSDEQLSKDIKEKLHAQLVEEGKELKSFEIDLHIEELIDNHQYMTNHEILTKQMGVCRSFIQQALDKNTKRIVLIHGKGEGILKAEIHAYLNKLRYLNDIQLEYHDASYSEYGMGGATEVIFL